MNAFLSVPLEVEPWFVQLLKLLVLKSDKDAQIIFLYTYSQYSSPEDLFLAAEDLYLNTGFEKAKHEKLASFLYLWLSVEEQLDRKLRRKVLDLAKLYNPTNNESPIAKAAKRFRCSIVSASYQKFRDSVALPPSPRDAEVSSDSSSSSSVSPRCCDLRASLRFPFPEAQQFDILKFPTGALAKQMTLIDYDFVSSATIAHLKNKIFRPDEGKYGTVSDCSHRFNKMSFWVATQIVTAPNLKTRVDLVEKFIAIAAKLYKYRNFFGAYQILSGMHNANVRRLRSCWKQVSQRSTNTLSFLEQAMSHMGNFANYRNCIRDCLAKRTPAIPLVCLLLQDLTFINDGNENLLSDGKVNFEKWTLFGTCMLNFSRLTEPRYSFHKNSTIKRMLINDLVILPETLLMKHSYAIEARKRFPTHGTSF